MEASKHHESASSTWASHTWISAISVSPQRRGGIAVAAAVLVGVLLTGCDGGASDGSKTPDPTVSAPMQDARGNAEQQALDAYRGMWRAYAKAGLTANPDEPDLAKYANGGALKTLTDGLRSLKSKGQVIRGEFDSNPQVTSASPAARPTAVEITDCLDDSDFLTYKNSGEPADDDRGGRRSAIATASNLGTDGWKVTSFAVQGVGTC